MKLFDFSFSKLAENAMYTIVVLFAIALIVKNVPQADTIGDQLKW